MDVKSEGSAQSIKVVTGVAACIVPREITVYLHNERLPQCLCVAVVCECVCRYQEQTNLEKECIYLAVVSP